MRSPHRVAKALLPPAVLATGLTILAPAVQAEDRVYRAQKADPVKPRIVGGAEIGIAQAPWQVRVSIADPNAGADGVCGGSVLTPTTVVTAAHCVVSDATGLNVAPANLGVNAGVSGFAPNAFGAPAPEPGDAPQQRAVTVNRVHPGYPRPVGGGGVGTIADFVDDAAVLTLASPLTFGPAVQPLPVTARNVLSPIGRAGTVAGFGSQTEPPSLPNGQLFQLGQTVQDDSLFAGSFNALFVTGLAPGGSFCSGDSGGPLNVDSALIGIVSSSPSCAPNAPNNYTDVSAGEIQDFLAGNDAPPLAPRGGQDVSLIAPAGRSPRQGDDLPCSAGTWTNNPSFTYEFTDSRTFRVLQSGLAATYRVTGTTDAGATISCRGIASTDGGVGRTPPTQPTTAVTAAPPPRPAPTPSPTPTPRPPTTPDVDDDLSLSVAASASRIRRGSRVTFTLTLRNRGDRALTGVRQCATLSSAYTVVSRGGGRVSGGRICFSRSSLRTSGTFRTRYTVRIDRDARLGRLVQRARVTSTQGVADSGRRTVRVLPSAARRPAPRPPFVTG